VLVDVEENGTSRHLLVQANRNGFLYVLDRSNGKFVRASPFVQKLNWATVIDPSGGPLLSVEYRPRKARTSAPASTALPIGFSPSYNPDTGLFYVMALESCNLYFSNPKPFTPGKTYYGTGTKLPPDEHAQKTLLAFSVSEGKRVWSYPQVGHADSWGGTMATAGELVFFGDDAGSGGSG